MNNTYAINTTRGFEFEVARELDEMGVTTWVPKQLLVKHVKEKKSPVWYDKPYVGKLLFGVFPAVLYRDVCEHKHVIGKPLPLTRRDISGAPSYSVKTLAGSEVHVPAVPGLRDFKAVVDDEYADMERRRDNSEWVCAHKPGDALRILEGPFEGFAAIFKEIARARDGDLKEVRVEVEVFGRPTALQIAPDLVEKA
ncbi:MAG: hypothetical protein ABJ360_22490 [Roseobacter sp.]